MIFIASPGRDVSYVNFIISSLDAKHNKNFVLVITKLYSEQIQQYEVYRCIVYDIFHARTFL